IFKKSLELVPAPRIEFATNNGKYDGSDLLTANVPILKSACSDPGLSMRKTCRLLSLESSAGARLAAASFCGSFHCEKTSRSLRSNLPGSKSPTTTATDFSTPKCER